jgi:predicted dehydrogenase/serine acetyltransferase
VSASTRVAVLGCGAWGRNIVRAFADLDALAAVADTSASAAAAAAEQFSVPALSPEEALSGTGIDAVAIAAPAVLHAELALQALDSGCHVFVEKPLALQLADAEKVVARAAEVNRVLMVGHLLQYHPAFLALADLVAQGELGRLLYVYSNRLNLGRFRREENALWSFAPHDISMILRLVGEEPERVSAVGAPFLHPTLADVTTTHLEFPSGVRGHVFVSWLHPYKDQRLVAVGDHGMAVFDDGQPWESKLVVYRHQIDWRDGVPTPTRADGDPVAVPRGEPLRAECAHFLECCDTGQTPRTDGHEGLRVLRVLTTAQDAIEHGPVGDLARSARFDGVEIHPSAEVDAGAVIGPGTRVWHYSHVLSGSRIGAGCVLGQNVMVGPDAIVGDGCKLQNNVSVYKGVTLGENVFCGPSAVFTNVLYPRAHIERKDEFVPTYVGIGVTIGANATIVCGTTIGEYATIAAGAVVTHDVPAYALMAGVPARRIGWVGAAGEPLDDDLVCPRTGRRYRLVAPDELEELPG